MGEIFRKPHNIKLPKSQHEVEEFSAEKGLVLCKDCGVCYYKKRWHAGLEKLNLPEKDQPMHFASCPACTMINNKQYEGRVTIKNFPDNQSEQLEKLVEGFGNRAYDRDPMDRVIEIKKLGNGNWQITTTENELANKLAHKIKDTFNKLKSEIRFAPEPSDVAEITIKF